MVTVRRKSAEYKVTNAEKKQVCLALLSAVIIHAFAAERRRLLHGARSAPADIDRGVLTGRLCRCRSTGQTDGRTPDRYTGLDPALHSMRAALTTKNNQAAGLAYIRCWIDIAWSVN